MGALDHIDIEIIVGKDRTTHRGTADGVAQNSKFFKSFTNQPMRYPMSTARTVMGIGLSESGCFFENHAHTAPPAINSSAYSISSAGSGITPPQRP